MTPRAAIALALIAVGGGCGRLEAGGLGDTDDLLDATPGETIAADAALDSQQPDTAELVDTEPPDTGGVGDAAADADETEAGTPMCDSTDPTLIACYRFEDAEQPKQPHDESMYAHHGTSTGVTFAAGKEGRAMIVSSTSYTNVPDSATLAPTTAITIETWIRVKSFPPSGRAGIADCNLRFGLFLLPGGAVRATTPAPLDTAAVLKLGTWHHLAYTYDGARQVIYVDGAIVKEAALAGGTFGTGDGAGLAIGMNSPSGDNLDGALDSMRIFRIARTKAQICAAAGKNCS